jgi:3-hydroxyisobutyrate dehydrogenase
MALNLAAKKSASDTLIVFDKVDAACKLLEKNGARVAATCEEVAASSDVIITMLRSDAQVTSVYDAIADNVRSGSLLIDSSTVNYETSRAISAKTAFGDCDVIDAPVSGGVGAAQAGTLTFICGGKQASFERAKPVLSLMGANVFHCGEKSGSGQIVKIVNNLMLAIQMTSVAEGMNLGIKLGVDAKVLTDIISVSTGRCWSMDTYNPVPGVFPDKPASNDYNGGFVVDLMCKDLKLALEAAKSCDAETPLGAHAAELYDELSTNGLGNKDFGVIYREIAAGALKKI